MERDKCLSNKVEIILVLTFQGITFQQKKKKFFVDKRTKACKTCLDYCYGIGKKSIYLLFSVFLWEVLENFFLLWEMRLMIANIIMHSAGNFLHNKIDFTASAQPKTSFCVCMPQLRNTLPFNWMIHLIIFYPRLFWLKLSVMHRISFWTHYCSQM